MDLAVIGAGAWGTAFALQLAANGHKVLLWAYEPELVRVLRDTRENTYYLPGFRLPEGIEFTDDLRAAVKSSSRYRHCHTVLRPGAYPPESLAQPLWQAHARPHKGSGEENAAAHDSSN